ncbi:MAG: hypothetical protein EAZ74_03030 [Alphaproteobacteria bacterium]|nr:MAG: hypothetical protein EAY76_03700 [Alphaproteobacteria bacterium]TAF14878.1 MAG: hypothetical protein EAZ74_03030 [Alphaproteobacteria bacterium]TAF41437.1 MAG: hypothetical protein EAZ66_01425 [Alphaproteobacteria bacterium]TAF75394.1 MAG: hypothetical protein EAZ52_06840 [Alphaproteobacteria bacterium]
MTDEHLLDLRNKILEQQQMVTTLLKLLLGATPNADVTLPSCHEHRRVNNSIPSTYGEILHAFEQRKHQDSSVRELRQMITTSEKEPPSALFIKLSQMMLKWSECELAVLKELRRDTSNGSEDASQKPLNPEEWDIMRHYLDATERTPNDTCK